MTKDTAEKDAFPALNVVQMIDSLGTGGTEKMVLLLAKKCAEMDVPFTVISLDDDAGSDVASEIRAAGGRVFNFPAAKLLDLKRISSIRSLLQREKFDLVHSYLTYSNIIGCLTGFLAGIPVICSLRNLGDAPMYYHPGRRFLETLCLNLLARRVMCNGYAILRAHSSRVITRPITVIPNAATIPQPISSLARTAVRKELAGNPSRPIVISVGRLIPLKGFAELISAIDLARKEIPDILLLIAGDGIEQNRLENQIARLGLSQNVTLLGYRKDTTRLLQAADVYVSASTSEGMSVAILEGMAAGLPVIATDVGDAARVVVPGAGIVIPTNAPAGIAEAIVAILSDREHGARMGAAARDHIQAQLSPDAWIRKIQKLYLQAVGKKTENE